MPYEFPERRPRSESFPPREDEEDQRAHDLARLHERIMEERLDPVFRVEGRGMEAPAVGRIEDDPGHLPDSIHEEVVATPKPTNRRIHNLGAKLNARMANRKTKVCDQIRVSRPRAYPRGLSIKSGRIEPKSTSR